GLLLRSGGPRRAFHEIDFRLEDFDFAHQLAVQQRPPFQGNVDHLGLEKRHGNLSRGLFQGHVLDAVGAAPQADIDVGDVPAVIGDFVQLAVDEVQQHGGQRNSYGNQYNDHGCEDE